MANYRAYNQAQSLMMVLDAKELKKNNPLLCAIDEFINDEVDITRFEEHINNDSKGAPAKHPKMMLKIIFYAYAKEIYSAREIEERLKWDQHFIYLSGSEKVDHTTICKFILEYKDEIKEIFTNLVYIMYKLGYVSLDYVAIDGSKLKANVGKKFKGDRAEFEAKRKRIEKKIEKAMSQLKDENDDDEIDRQNRKINNFNKEKEKITDFLKGLKKDRKDKTVNLVDPEAKRMKSKDGVITGYNSQIGVDGKNHIIVGTDVFNEATDRHLLKPMIESIQKNTKQENLIVGADAGYYSSVNMKYCYDKGHDLYMPEGDSEDGKRKSSRETIESRDCKLEIRGDEKYIVCPGGQTMDTHLVNNNRGIQYYQSYAKREICLECKHRSKCFDKVKATKKFTVKKEYFETKEIRDEMTAKLLSKKGRRLRAMRSCVVEHVFGQIKEHMKFRKFMHRGLEKVRTIWDIISLAYNFKKLAKLRYA
jgi:transposase/transcriptional regulator NrdR family protein